MKSKIKLILFFGVIIFLSSCNDMNDDFNKYLKNGEIIYIAKADSVKTYAGNERFLTTFFMNDPRADTICIYWNQKQDSLLVPIVAHNPLTPIQVTIGKNQKTIPEGNYVLQFVTRSMGKYKSVTVESSVNVYGTKYAASLLPRLNKTVTYTAATSILSLTWGTPMNDQEKGIKLSYWNNLNVAKDTVLSTTALTTTTTLKNVDKTKPVSFKTIFVPELTAIDTFYTSKQSIVIP